jgi:hypothetical protein
MRVRIERAEGGSAKSWHIEITSGLPASRRSLIWQSTGLVVLDIFVVMLVTATLVQAIQASNNLLLLSSPFLLASAGIAQYPWWRSSYHALRHHEDESR